MEIKSVRQGWVYYDKKTETYAKWITEDYDSGYAFLGNRWEEVEDAYSATMYRHNKPLHDQFNPPPDRRRFKLKNIRVTTRTFITVENL